jgi:hypothetical protein
MWKVEGEAGLTGIAVPRKQEQPLYTAVGFSLHEETNVGVDEAAAVVLASMSRLNGRADSP